MEILTKYLFTDGEFTDCNDCTDYVLPLKKGDRGDAVEDLQEALNDQGYDCGKADGIFGNNTENALEDWQEDHGYEPDGQEAFLLTEYGGIAIDVEGSQEGAWGYHGKESDEESFFERYNACTEAILQIPFCQGYCYTQLTDIMQEINGLLTPDRKPKMDVERIRKQNYDPTK